MPNEFSHLRKTVVAGASYLVNGSGEFYRVSVKPGLFRKKGPRGKRRIMQRSATVKALMRGQL